MECMRDVDVDKRAQRLHDWYIVAAAQPHRVECQVVFPVTRSEHVVMKECTHLRRISFAGLIGVAIVCLARALLARACRRSLPPWAARGGADAERPREPTCLANSAALKSAAPASSGISADIPVDHKNARQREHFWGKLASCVRGNHEA